MTMPHESIPLGPQDGTARPGWTPLLDALPQGVMLVDAAGRYLEVNPAAADILGLDRETLLSCILPKPLSNLSEADGSVLAPGDFPGLVALRNGTPVRRKTIGWNREDGSTLWLEVSAEPLHGGGALVNFDDITEPRLQSRKVERLTELYSALSQVNQAIVWSPTKEALLDKICEVMVELGKFAMAWIGWNDPETHEVRIVSKYGDTNGYLDGLQVRSDDTPLGRGATGTAIREGHTCVVNDFHSASAASPWHGAAIRAGIAASAAVPIRKDGKVCGALMVYATEKNYFGSQEIMLLEEAAGDIAFAMDHHELDAKHRQDEELLKENERKYRKLFETMTEGVALHELVKDANGEIQDYRILDVNRSFQRHTGLDSTIALGRLATELYGTTLPPYLKEFSRVALTSEPCAFETFFPPLDKHFRISVFSPNPEQFATVFEDITERKRNENILVETMQRFQLATASASMGVWDWNLLSGSMTWDDRMFELYGSTREEIHGTKKDWKDGIHPEDMERAITECETALRGEAPFNTEFRLKHKDGTILWIKANGLVIRDDRGNPLRMIGLYQDITERKQAETEICSLNEGLELRVKERTAELEAANVELEAFSYSVSHDLRTPLQSIKGFSEILAEQYQDRLDEIVMNYVSRIRLSAKRMGEIIEDLLKLSHVNRNKLIISDVDLSSLWREVDENLAMTSHDGRKSGVYIQAGLRVRADHHLMQMMLGNMLSNSWKFTSKRQDPKIEVGEMVGPDGARTFYIRDNGAGFDMAHADKLFQAFQRLHSTKDYEGTGIGLTIVQRIIHRHGGRIWAEGEPGKGATFFFTIPERTDP